MAVHVAGLGIVSPIGTGASRFAAALRAGTCGIVPVEDEGGAAHAAPLGSFDLRAQLSDVPDDLRRSALRLAGRSPFAVQAAACAAVQAWLDAGLDRRAGLDPERIGLVVAGNNLTAGHAEQLRPVYERGSRFVPPRFALQMQDTDHVGVLSHILGIRGEGCTVGAASASGTVAIVNAARLVASGAVDVCLVVGALADLTPMERAAFRNLGAMADGPEPPGSPFDGAHRGFVPGQAAACLVLEAGAERPLAEVAGYAMALDGNSLADPDESGEVRAVRRALAVAGLDPADIAYVNTHGSGSRLGDRTELDALRRVFGPHSGRPWLNATKGMTGHCLGAAGVVEAVATVVQMRDGFVHPNVGLRDPIETGWRFVGAEAVDVAVPTALSTSFGFGGFNACVVLKEAAA
ncbi:MULTISPECIES: beta-ketoacyl synthase N-terminal-like domain-containing protein [Streptomyces]|uniref:beta-ketoacyl synthase N-terminal-like domain-containing protein n=1 Tax=Streptomyces TaxID=1883 RepID=UPI0004C026DF|nr:MULTISPECIES: beta-ketoacyl synthase N-terminal-like domain-containing protein [Streptomyces]